MPRKIKERVHREWFLLLSTKTCPCGSNRTRGGTKYPVYAWGEYQNGNWRTIEHFCQVCFPAVREKLLNHGNSCGCSFELIGRHGTILPDWLTLHPKTIEKQLSFAI